MGLRNIHVKYIPDSQKLMATAITTNREWVIMIPEEILI